jgi:hypothetical protein
MFTICLCISSEHFGTLHFYWPKHKEFKMNASDFNLSKQFYFEETKKCTPDFCFLERKNKFLQNFSTAGPTQRNRGNLRERGASRTWREMSQVQNPPGRGPRSGGEGNGSSRSGSPASPVKLMAIPKVGPQRRGGEKTRGKTHLRECPHRADAVFYTRWRSVMPRRAATMPPHMMLHAVHLRGDKFLQGLS